MELCCMNMRKTILAVEEHEGDDSPNTKDLSRFRWLLEVFLPLVLLSFAYQCCCECLE